MCWEAKEREKSWFAESIFQTYRTLGSDFLKSQL